LTIRRQSRDDVFDGLHIIQKLIHGESCVAEFRRYRVGVLKRFLAECPEQIVNIAIHMGAANLLLQAQIIGHGFQAIGIIGH
jgi:hypothetical protein